MVDKVERTVSEYAWLSIKCAHVQRPLFGNAGRLLGPGRETNLQSGLGDHVKVLRTFFMTGRRCGA
jgi:hypothetical protein